MIPSTELSFPCMSSHYVKINNNSLKDIKNQVCIISNKYWCALFSCPDVLFDMCWGVFYLMSPCPPLDVRSLNLCNEAARGLAAALRSSDGPYCLYTSPLCSPINTAEVQLITVHNMTGRWLCNCLCVFICLLIKYLMNQRVDITETLRK